jgi:hypothetical protein
MRRLENFTKINFVEENEIYLLSLFLFPNFPCMAGGKNKELQRFHKIL